MTGKCYLNDCIRLDIIRVYKVVRVDIHIRCSFHSSFRWQPQHHRHSGYLPTRSNREVFVHQGLQSQGVVHEPYGLILIIVNDSFKLLEFLSLWFWTSILKVVKYRGFCRSISTTTPDPMSSFQSEDLSTVNLN